MLITFIKSKYRDEINSLAVNQRAPDYIVFNQSILYKF